MFTYRVFYIHLSSNVTSPEEFPVLLQPELKPFFLNLKRKCIFEHVFLPKFFLMHSLGCPEPRENLRNTNTKYF